MTGLSIDSYEWAGGREAMLRFGPERAPVVVAALPLLEEGNRTRAFAVAVLRTLSFHGIGGALPDLPGTFESMVAPGDMRLADLRSAYVAAAARFENAWSFSIRSGALLDGDAKVRGRWRLSPQDGKDVLREWHRIAPPTSPGQDLDVAGNAVSAALMAELGDAYPADGAAPSRAARLGQDPRPADLVLEAAPLWRRTEPGNDIAMAQQVAEDIASWIATCAA